MDRQLIVDLADAPVSLWPVLVDRHGILLPFAYRTNSSVAEADEAARQLGVSRRRFYSLLAEFRARLRDGRPYSHNTGRTSLISPDQDQAIQDACRAAGGNARLDSICAEVRRLCDKRKIAEPSINAVRGRLGHNHVPVDLKRCFRLEASVVADLARLRLQISDGPLTQPCHLLAVFCADTSRVLWHEVYAGLPAPREMKDDLTYALRELNKKCAQSPQLGLECQLPDAAIDEPWRTRQLQSSTLIRRVFGLTIGRIARLCTSMSAI